ncbi:98bcb0d1-d493-4b7c-8817-0a47768b614d [Thermothielavioides terrestris]|uniref:98bcb0d1-d493-4b7c-8817-0a47768b614d n=1 Tax=Thermothielavioides terrestris TaxID=2587410 RepID=A0A446BNK9_9PEZI|nr:98bcb0d1-d493-4b7c-8817-0a47768b614d [Thermothielavioides terrestris]
MLDSASLLKLLALLGLAAAVAILGRRMLLPRRYPGIPYNTASAGRISGDLPDLMPVYRATNEVTRAIADITTRKLGTPIAQLLFPSVRRPLIVVDDPREVEDIVVRRNKQFDRAPTFVGMFKPMFPTATISQFTTPALRAQKRLWADVMSTEFLRRVAAPNIHRSASELVELWRLKASTVHRDRPFDVHEDFKDATLDVIWTTVVGDNPGATRYSIQRLQSQLAGKEAADLTPPDGHCIKEQVAYINDAIARADSSVIPPLALKLQTYTARYRKFRRTVNGEMRRAMQKAAGRFHSLEVGRLEDEAIDRCAMDLVLRRQILQAKKAGVTPSDPTRDQTMLDEMFVLLVAGHDSTANTLCWFLRIMELYPAVQDELRAVLRAAFPGPAPPSAAEIVQADVPYLDAACEETFRLSCTATCSLRQALVDTHVLGCPVPKGAELLLIYCVDRAPPPVDEALRSDTSRASAEKLGDGLQGAPGRDLGTFQPRRWLVRDEQTGKEVFNAYAVPSLTFGGGYRGCFGRKLAVMELRIMVVLLILSFEFLPLPEDLRGMSAHEKVFREPDFPA